MNATVTSASARAFTCARAWSARIMTTSPPFMSETPGPVASIPVRTNRWKG